VPRCCLFGSKISARRGSCTALNVASTEAGGIGGGYKNEIFSNGAENGFDAAIFAGYENKTDGEYAAIP
jgi:hypothetical protein